MDHSKQQTKMNWKLNTNQLFGPGMLYNSANISDILSILFDNARLIWDSGRGRWHTEPSSSVLRPETRARARPLLRVRLVRPVVAPCCILADTQPPVSASAQPLSSQSHSHSVLAGLWWCQEHRVMSPHPTPRPTRNLLSPISHISNSGPRGGLVAACTMF